MVQWVVEDAGPSGHSGFTLPATALVQQKHPEFEHSDYFFDLNYSRNWIPFLLGQPLPQVVSAPDRGRAAANWRLRVVLTIVLMWCLGALVVAAQRYGSSIARPIQTNPAAASSPASVASLFSGFV